MPSLLGNLRSYFSKLVYLFKFKPPFLYNFDPEIRLRIQIYRLRYKKSLQNIGYHTNILEIANPKIFFHWDLGNLKLSSELELYSGGVLELKKPNKKYFSIPSILPEINAIPGISIIRPSLPKRQIIKHKEYNSHFLDLLLPECYKYSFYRLTLDDNFKCPPVQTTRFDKSSIELFAKQFSFFLLTPIVSSITKSTPLLLKIT